jgi:hypothetical protein
LEKYAFSSGQTGQAPGFEISGPHTIAALKLVATISNDAQGLKRPDGSARERTQKDRFGTLSS